eukprot:6942079-Alexandrium_andersonii.AAC.1
MVLPWLRCLCLCLRLCHRPGASQSLRGRSSDAAASPSSVRDHSDPLRRPPETDGNRHSTSP